MRETSLLYQKEIRAVQRADASARIRLGLMDLDAVTTVTQLSGSSDADFSRIASSVYEDGIPQKVYATFEPGRMRLDGSQIIMPAQDPKPQGWVSRQLSGADGVYAEPPCVDIAFSKTHRVIALTFVFDRAAGDWPSDFLIEAWRGQTKILTEQAHPTDAEFVSANRIESFDRLRFTWRASSKPFRRARLQQILFGVGLILDGKRLQQVSQSAETDPLSRRLPTSKFSFSVLNFDGAYNPDDPSARWELMEQQSPIWLQWGQRIRKGLTWGDMLTQTWESLETSTWGQIFRGGYTEIFDGGRYYLTSQPTVQGNTAKFEAHTILDRMKETFLKSVWQTQALYDMAQSVLLDAELPLLDNGVQPWKLWEGLKSISTQAYLPNTSGANCLQLIANAACCVLFVDRDGYIRIEPAPQEVHDYALDFSAQTGSYPTVEKTPTVRSVGCKQYTYALDASQTEPSELHKMTYNVSGTASLFIEFSGPSAQVTLEVLPPEVPEGAPPATTNVTGALVPYVHSARVNLTGNGEAQIVLRGRAIQASHSIAYQDIPNADEHGGIEHMENPLVTDSARANAIAKWAAAYFARRTAYTFTHRGDPSIDPLDNVHIQSRYDADFAATVVYSETQFDGTLTAKAVVKRL